MNESEKPFFLTRAASSTSGRAKKQIPIGISLIALTAGFGWLLAGHASAQTFKTLYNFTGQPDGSNPMAGLILSSNTLYGTTFQGGTYDGGTVFKINTDGTGYTNMHSFNGSY